MAVVDAAEAIRTGPLLFNGAKPGWPIGKMALPDLLKGIAGPEVTVHGLRSSFRDWAADNAVPREVAEACLAHAVEGEIEGAYWRSDILERRRQVMQRWAAFVTGEAVKPDKPELEGWWRRPGEGSDHLSPAPAHAGPVRRSRPPRPLVV
jgi:hypothetical protein